MLKFNWKAILEFCKKILQAFKKKGGGKMKMKLVALVLGITGIVLLTSTIGSVVMAQETFTLKQGVLLGWEEGTIKNITSIKVAETIANPNWSKLANAFWSGNVVEAGWVYDNGSADSVALMVGRKIGTLGDYLPIKFPLADKIEITVYPIGLMASNLTSQPKFSGVSGGSYLQLKF